MIKSQFVILHIRIPRQVPVEERQAIRLDNDALNSELLRMTDAYTDELFPLTPVEAGRVIFPVSRLVCDVERFPLDEDEAMADRGMGVIYTRTSMGEELRACRPSPCPGSSGRAGDMSDMWTRATARCPSGGTTPSTRACDAGVVGRSLDTTD